MNLKLPLSANPLGFILSLAPFKLSQGYVYEVSMYPVLITAIQASDHSWWDVKFPDTPTILQIDQIPPTRNCPVRSSGNIPVFLNDTAALLHRRIEKSGYYAVSNVFVSRSTQGYNIEIRATRTSFSFLSDISDEKFSI